MHTFIFKRIFKFMSFINEKILILHISSMIPDEQNYILCPKIIQEVTLKRVQRFFFQSLLLIWKCK